MSGLDEATPLDHARLFARIIHATANGVVELRAVAVPMKYGAPGVVAGYYDDLLAVFAQVRPLPVSAGQVVEGIDFGNFTTAPQIGAGPSPTPGFCGSWVRKRRTARWMD